MSVHLEPAELGFKRPFQQEVTQYLRLSNPHTDPIAFKVKTTAPKQYCVRPNSGRIEPGGTVEVQILLQAMKEDPAPDAKCRDKFLVQSVLVTADKEFSNVASLWSNIEQTSKSSIQERKIRVLFLPADDVVASTPKTNGVSQDHASLSSPSPEAVTPQRALGSAETPVPVQFHPIDSKNHGEARESVYSPAASGITATVSAAAAAVTKAIPTTSEELQAQLADAKATISRLTQQAESGLRQRKTESASTSKGSAPTAIAQQAPAGGVSVQITALLCLVSFLLAYLFF